MSAYIVSATCDVPTEKLERRLCQVADAGPSAIEDRLHQLEGEWSAGRVTRVALAVVIVGLVLGFVADEWWFLLPAAAGLFLLQYTVSRRCGLTTVARGLGFREGHAIEEEKFALKALRGDFHLLPTVHEVATDPDALSRMEGEGGPAYEDDTPRIAPQEAVHQVLEAARR